MASAPARCRVQLPSGAIAGKPGGEAGGGPRCGREGTVAARRSPTVRRRRLGIELRRLREHAGLTIEKVATALECSDSKISRIETGRVGATPRDVRDMLDLYGVGGEQREALIQVARDARQKDWWQAYSDTFAVPLVGLEAAASSIRIYGALVVPGLFQTADYARAVIRATRPDLPAAQVERWVQLRMARQELLARDDPPQLCALLDESVVRRPVGSRQVMREQLRHLVEAAALPALQLQVLPFSAGEHAALAGAFSIFGFPDPADPDVVFLEHGRSDLYLENAEEVERHVQAFARLRGAAAGRQRAAAELARLLAEAGGPT
jgi:transcriptional regulator with XRE-family HTH domain